MKYRTKLFSLGLLAIVSSAHAQTWPDFIPAAPGTSPSHAGSLDQYTWTLSSATDAFGNRINALFPRAGKPLQLNFTQTQFSVENSCNLINGTYHMEGGRLKIGALASTRMYCSNQALSKLDGAISRHLKGQPNLYLYGEPDRPQLRMTRDNGRTLVFTGEPTAETRYGSAGETAFLEVAAQSKPCNHPLIPDKQCLEVRELKYGKSGLVQSTGEWQRLYQDIEGYTHEPGIRDVLRVTRFAIKNPPADAPSAAYVLDMMVQSEEDSKKQ